jgi:hypothetical protein
LIEEKFPWFLESWLKYPYNIQRADVLRYFVLYEYGGIYLVSLSAVCPQLSLANCQVTVQRQAWRQRLSIYTGASYM